MDDPARVRRAEGIGHRHQQGESLGVGQGASSREKRRERFADQKLHHEKGRPPFHLPVIEDLNDVSMRKTGRHFRLTKEACGHRPIRRIAAIFQHFNRDGLVRCELLAFPDDADSPLAEGPYEAVSPGQDLARLEDNGSDRRHRAANVARTTASREETGAPGTPVDGRIWGQAHAGVTCTRMGPLAECLFGHVDKHARGELRAIADLDDRLRRIIDEGAIAHPDLVLRDDVWIDYFVRHIPPDGAEAFLGSVHVADVHLVLACLAGLPAAHRRLDESLRRVAVQAVLGIRLEGLSVEELLQEVRTKLLVHHDRAEHATAPSPHRTLPKLASYAGRGPLEGWLRVTVTRTAISLLRHGETCPPTHDPEKALAEIAAKNDPQLQALQARCAPALEHAIEEAVRALPPEERTLIRLYFIDGLTIDDLAAVYRAHRATMARRLARIRNTIFEQARAQTLSALGLDESEFQSLLGVMMSVLDLTLRGALKSAKDLKPG